MTGITVVKCKNSKKIGYLEMTRDHQDISGKRYAAGTLYKPIRNGFDHAKGYFFHEAEIRGKRVIFADRKKQNNVGSILHDKSKTKSKKFNRLV